MSRRRQTREAIERNVFLARAKLFDLASAILARDLEAAGHARREVERRHHSVDLLNVRLGKR